MKYTIADVREPEKIALVKEVAKIMGEKLNFDRECRLTSTINFQSLGKNKSDAFLDIFRNLRTQLEEFVFSPRDISRDNFYDDILDFLVQSWEHLDEDWNDWFVWRCKVEYGAKTFLYRNVHPTFEMLEKRNPVWDKSVLVANLVIFEMPEEEILQMLVSIVAYYCLREDFFVFFHYETKRLPDDMKKSFTADAERLLGELKQYAKKITRHNLKNDE